MKTVGVIGLGIMGSAMAGNLMRAGYAVIGYDLRDEQRRKHARARGRSARSAREVGESAQVVITSLPSSKALLDTAKALATAARVPRVVIETSTLPIDVKEAARVRLA